LLGVNINMLWKALNVVVLPIVVAICLLGNFTAGNIAPSRDIVGDVLSVVREHGAQWILELGVVLSCVIFILLQNRQTAGTFWDFDARDLWLVGIAVIGLLGYFSYRTYLESFQAFTMFAGMALGKGTSLWTSWAAKLCQLRVGNLTSIILLIIICNSGTWIIWPLGTIYQYQEQMRWSGIWENPNIYGLLVGVGITIAFGLLAYSYGAIRAGETSACKCKVWRLSALGLLGMSIGSMGLGLVRSYSRGAWVATVCGVFYLLALLSRNWRVWQCIALERGHENDVSCAHPHGLRLVAWLHRNRSQLCGILLVVGFVAVSHLRNTEQLFARRAFSALNTVDCSWRNRIAAWEGALQITAEHPLLGTGWGKPEPLFGHYYMPPKLNESAAIEMNDYFMLGATLGIPALFCFCMYLWLSLTRKAESGKQKAEIREADWLQTTCRAGAVVLLIGFWFDGGLFKLPTAATFWILLELGAAAPSQSHTVTAISKEDPCPILNPVNSVNPVFPL